VITTADDSAEQTTLLTRAQGGDRDAFQRLAEPYRRELQGHCYRMLGSFQDAEDLVQDTFLRAWRSLRAFERRSSFRNWLYRVATNACLNALASRASARRARSLPESLGPASDHMPGPTPSSDIAWLEPYPDAALAGVADRAPGPAARYEMREAVHLSFVAAVQLLPPRQRAALLLHDVLGWTSAETAQLLRGSVASVNSLLQRARATLEQELAAGRAHVVPRASSDQERAVIERYIRTWESGDTSTFVDLLTEDAVLSMPPWPNWYRGPAAIVAVIAWTSRPGGRGPFRLVATAANGQPAFAFYSRFGQDAKDAAWRAHSIQLLTLRGAAIANMTSFVSSSLFPAFGLPDVLPPDAGQHGPRTAIGGDERSEVNG
jgi:RNA polymerase sigma-70 factor, ECF subfamily